ncbi:alpha/beta fold hydrolase [Blastococcus sp. TF02A-26]|uniref:alpha/beta fold hydrolase n=1 Tax=Blastococcus sp. TF02A-26 TaxID=2250577 RepID=UPI000DEA614D|nr:alpha/beta fold hydrolase [Blastococcus sp. TF02A-26]RBY90814.1 hypothetical protein DQ240_01845 [Blastococcus sp. TF02A-26]
MADLVLQHGAWHGGWSWQPVAQRLRAAGHRVSTVTSPGLGIDDDPRGVTLADCVDALVAHVESTDRRDVTLVGHSWGGYVVAGAAPRLADRLGVTPVTVPGSHESMFTRPAELADALAAVSTGTAASG